MAKLNCPRCHTVNIIRSKFTCMSSPRVAESSTWSLCHYRHLVPIMLEWSSLTPTKQKYIYIIHVDVLALKDDGMVHIKRNYKKIPVIIMYIPTLYYERCATILNDEIYKLSFVFIYYLLG